MMDNEKISGLSMDIEQTERDKLRSVFPQCFVEGKLDIDKLLNLCGEYITDDFEKYEFRWKGKSECVQIAGKRSNGALRPCVEESVDWENTKNIYIEGDNLEVLKLLQTSYYRKVKMIYIDPPYNTGNDFVYEDDFKVPLQRYKEIISQTTKSNPETMGRFHTNWLNMMWPRLRLAANLLRDDGVIFISIDDGEVHNLRKLCDEIFGEENFIAIFPWRKRTAKSDVPFGVSQDFEWIIGYVKSDGATLGLSFERKYYQSDDFPNDRWRLSDLTTQKIESQRPNSAFDLIDPKTNKIYKYNPKRLWGITKDTFQDYYDRGKIVFPDDYGFLKMTIPAYRVFESEDKAKALEKYGHELPMKAISTLLPEDVGRTENGNKECTGLLGNNIFSFPKPSALIKHFISSCTNGNDIIFDFFSGSATTAQAVMQLNAEDGGNRRFILVQLPEVCDGNSEAAKAGYASICEIGKERIRRAGAKIKADNPLSIDTLDAGFRVFKLDTSNTKVWDNTPITGENAEEILERRLFDYLDVLLPGRTDEDVVYEVMLKMGQDLCEPIVSIELDEKRRVYGVGADVNFIVCLAPRITPEDAELMADYAPGRIIFAEQCFNNTEEKSNVRLTLKDKGITIKTL